MKIFSLCFRCFDMRIFMHVIYKVRLHMLRKFVQITNHPASHFTLPYEREFSDYLARGEGSEERTNRSSAGELRGPKPSICFGPRHVELPPIRLPCIRMQSARELYNIALGPAVNCYQLHPLPFAYHTSLGCMCTYHLTANAAEKRKGRLMHVTYP